jgi:alginate O-acetyltransferase complex protein AlgI
MVFSSISFLLYFLPIFLFVYFLSSKKNKNWVILAFSIFFYSWGAPKFVFLLLASTFVDFYLVRFMHQTKEQRRKKILLGLSVTLNLGLLAFFKYSNFFIENVNDLLAVAGSTEIQWTKIALPIGISFYTFQTLTYSVDVYRKVHKPLDHVSDYMLYIMMFPQLIAGPIVRFSSIADQIEDREETYDDRLMGFYRFCIGLGKKVLIANVLGEAVASVIATNPEAGLFIDWNLINTPIAWWCILAYTFQIYFDFSGYSDMAIGIGRMLGFTFPENFDNPYTSRSITEFWRRWHITLGAFMREYLYIPLGGSKVDSKSRVYFNLWFVFLMSGLWHGASWNFVLWGAFHGVFLIIERVFLLSLFKKMGKLGNIVSLIYCFFIVMMGWVLFFIEDVRAIGRFYRKLFGFDFSIIESPYSTEFFVILFIAMVFAFSTLFSPIKKIHDLVFFGEYNTWQTFVMYFVAIGLFVLSVSSIASSSFNPFIYYRF